MQGTRGDAGSGVRLNVTKFHLTYAACDKDELDIDMIKARATAIAKHHGGMIEWSVGHELHKEPADPEREDHFHAYVCFRKRKDIANRFTFKGFDIISRNGNLRHPEIQGVGGSALDREKVVRYTMKDGDFECSDGLNHEFRRRKNTHDSPTKETWAEQLNRAVRWSGAGRWSGPSGGAVELRWSGRTDAHSCAPKCSEGWVSTLGT